MLANFGRENGRGTGRRTSRWQRIHPDRWAALDCADDGEIVRALYVWHGSEPLLAAHSVNYALLPPGKHGVRKNREIAERPEQIHALDKRRDDVTWPYRRVDLDHASHELLNQHTGPTWELF